MSRNYFWSSTQVQNHRCKGIFIKNWTLGHRIKFLWLSVYVVRQMTARARLVQSGIGLCLADVFVSASDMGHYYCYLLHFIIKTNKIVIIVSFSRSLFYDLGVVRQKYCETIFPIMHG